jgi:hypothetical protein
MTSPYFSEVRITKAKDIVRKVEVSNIGNSKPVIGYGIGGKVSQLKRHGLLKASCWSKQRRSVITRSHSHSTSDGYEIQVRQRHVSYRIPYVGYPLPH